MESGVRVVFVMWVKSACACVLVCMCLLTVQIIQENRKKLPNGSSVGRASQATEPWLYTGERISADPCCTMKLQCAEGHPQENVCLHSYTCVYEI